jgi:glutathione synthase/RimK-type ligase-like ATP-grasp enzyme
VYRIAIQPDDQLLTSGRRQSFSTRWVELAHQGGHEVRLVDAYDASLFDQLAGCDGFMWWFAHLPSPRNFAKRLLPAVEHGLGIPVFPSWRTLWHFDDKLAQQYLLEAAGVRTPRTWTFWRAEDAHAFCRSASYPLVIKLASGITSENVRLLRGVAEAANWVDRLFGAGVLSLEGSSLSRPRRLVSRLNAAARLALTGRQPLAGTRRMDLQRGYLLVQEFIPGNDFDTRVTVIGNRAYAMRRFNRPNDFRASGSGLRDSDPSKIDLETVRLAFRIAQALGTQSLAFDFLRRPGSGELVVVEISYYYEGWVLHEECRGHWSLREDTDASQLDWVERRVRPEDAIWEDFVAGLEAPRAGAATGTTPAAPPAVGPTASPHTLL